MTIPSTGGGAATPELLRHGFAPMADDPARCVVGFGPGLACHRAASDPIHTLNPIRPPVARSEWTTEHGVFRIGQEAEGPVFVGSDEGCREYLEGGYSGIRAKPGQYVVLRRRVTDWR